MWYLVMYVTGVVVFPLICAIWEGYKGNNIDAVETVFFGGILWPIMLPYYLIAKTVEVVNDLAYRYLSEYAKFYDEDDEEDE